MNNLRHFRKDHFLPYSVRFLICLMMTVLLAAGSVCSVCADEEEYIPDEYYEPIQSNAVEGWPEGQAIQASAGVVMDIDTGVFLYSKNCDRQLYPASITKIMTALLTLENADLDAVMTCSTIVYELDENASNVGLSEGEQMTIRDALYTLMLESANDTANALAEYVGGSMEGFAQMMNDRAAALGCTGTHFSNPSGLSADDHYTTAHDYALIAAEAYRNEGFRTLCSTVNYDVPPTNTYEETRYLQNHHRMLISDSDFYTSWCTGGKTGFTEKAWNTLVTYGERDGRRLVCVLLHGNGADQNYLETIDLLNYGFDNFRNINLLGSYRSKTMAQAMHVDYLGKASVLEAPELQQTISEFSGSPVVSVPQDADTSAIVVSPASDEAVAGEPKALNITYHTWPVGKMRLTVPTANLSLSYPWQRAVQVTMQGQTGDKENNIQDTKEIVWQNIGEFANEWYQRACEFVEQNRTAVIMTVGLLIIVLLVLLLVLLLQSSRDSRSRKKMKAAREEAMRREAEIDAKSALEIEEELRRAMAEEMARRTEDDWMEDPNLQDLDLEKRGDSE